MRRAAATFIPPIMLNSRKKSPIYRQLYDWLRTAITEGRMRPGQRLPSTRSMAAELRISRISAFNAYQQLQSEGYLETFVRSGTCVASTIPDDAFKPLPVEGKGPRKTMERFGGHSLSARARKLLNAPSEPWFSQPRRLSSEPARTRSVPRRALVETGGATFSKDVADRHGLRRSHGTSPIP